MCTSPSASFSSTRSTHQCASIPRICRYSSRTCIPTFWHPHIVTPYKVGIPKYLGAKNEALAAYRKAVELASQELKVNPHDPDVLSSVASYYSEMGDRDHALLYLGQSLQNGHNDKDILLDAATVYNNLGETGLAVEWLGK